MLGQSKLAYAISNNVLLNVKVTSRMEEIICA